MSAHDGSARAGSKVQHGVGHVGGAQQLDLCGECENVMSMDVKTKKAKAGRETNTAMKTASKQARGKQEKQSQEEETEEKSRRRGTGERKPFTTGNEQADEQEGKKRRGKESAQERKRAKKKSKQAIKKEEIGEGTGETAKTAQTHREKTQSNKQDTSGNKQAGNEERGREEHLTENAIQDGQHRWHAKGSVRQGIFPLVRDGGNRLHCLLEEICGPARAVRERERG